MRAALRWSAIAIAVAGVVDPAMARRTPAPLSIELRVPPASHPDFGRVQALREQVVNSLGDRAALDGRTAPHAVVVIGDADAGDVGDARVFAVALPAGAPETSITHVAVPRRTVPGQSVTVTASVRGVGLAGRTSAITLELGGVAVAAVQHSWTAVDERFDARLVFVPPAAGAHRLRVVVRTGGLPARSAADVLVPVRDEPLRVLMYEPRPSWPVAFVRRSLEADALFDVATLVRSSRQAVTISSGAPSSIASLDPDRYDVLVVGALDELRDADLAAIDRFTTERGGTVMLVPDRQMPVAVRGRFDLPQMEEVLLEKPAEVLGSGVSLRASELLLVSSEDHIARHIASVQQGNAQRAAIVSTVRGAGRIVVAGVPDAWRFRSGRSSAFDASWSALAADGALDAPPRVDVEVEPAIARPGDVVKISVSLRQTELERKGDTVKLPPVSAWLVAGGGRRDPIRLWPAARIGKFEAALTPAEAGRFTVSASIPGATTDVPLLVAGDVVHADPGDSGGPAYAARATGGAVVSDPGELARALASIDAGTEEKVTRPMRSPWWILPFALLLCGEWALRRRSGLR